MVKNKRYIDPEFKYKNRFNTILSKKDMKMFDVWANTPMIDGRLPINDIGAYDVMGYWKEYIKHGINPNDADNHGPDKYKKPNHPTFSDESKYASKRFPGGTWEDDGAFNPAPHTKKLYTREYYEEMFGREPNRSEHLGKYQHGGVVEFSNSDNMKKNIRLPEIEYKGNRFPVYLTEDEMYSFGGWLKENAGGLVQTVGGGLATAIGTGLIATGIGAPMGAALTGTGVSMLAGGVGGMLGNAVAEDPEVIDYSKETKMPRTVGKENMTPNVMPFKKGGNLTIKKSKRGSLHKALGIPMDKKIPLSMLKDKPGDSEIIKKKKLYARNARKWKHEEGGPINTLMPDLLLNMNLLRYSKKNLNNDIANIEIKKLFDERAVTPLSKKRAIESKNIEDKALKLFKDTYGRDMNIYDQQYLGIGNFRYNKNKKQGGGQIFGRALKKKLEVENIVPVPLTTDQYKQKMLDMGYIDNMSKANLDALIGFANKYPDQFKFYPRQYDKLGKALPMGTSNPEGKFYEMQSLKISNPLTPINENKRYRELEGIKKKGGKVHKVMKEFKEGTLHSGSKKGPIVTDRDQAIAIALSEERKSKKRKKAYGGELDEMLGQSDNLIDLTGMPKHEEGGVQFTPDAELEGGETVYKDVVNSDSIKITKEIADDYGLPKAAIGKTVSEYSKMVESKYKDREIDPFAMKSRELELNNLAKMSMDLAEEYKNNEIKKYGGKIKYQYGSPEELTGWRKRVHDRALEVQNRQKQSFLTELFDPISLAFNGKGWSNNNNENVNNPIIQKEPEFHLTAHNIYNEGFENNLTPEEAGYLETQVKPSVVNPVVTGSNIGGKPAVITAAPLIPSQASAPAAQPYPFTEDDYLRENIKLHNPIKDLQPVSTSNLFNVPEIKTPGIQPYKGTPGKPIVGGGNNVDWANLGVSALNAAPIAINAFMAAKTAKEGADKVKLGRIHAEEFNPELIDPEYQLSQVGDVFNTANKQMESQSKEDYLRRRIQSATEEAKSKSNVLGQVKQANAQMINHARELNQRSAMQADIYNLQAQMQEEQINAANKGAWQTARDYQLSSLGTMAGELGRDIRLEEANKTMNERYLNVLNEAIKQTGYTFDQQGTMSRIPNVVPATSAMEGSDSIYGTKFSNPSYGQYNPADSVYPGINLQQGVNNMPGYNNYRYLMNMRLPNINFNREYTGKF